MYPLPGGEPSKPAGSSERLSNGLGETLSSVLEPESKIAIVPRSLAWAPVAGSA